MNTPLQKKRAEQKGFDLLDAVYAEKGLISTGDSPHLISAKAVGDTHAHSEKHHQEKEKRHRAAFTENVNVRVQAGRAKFVETRGEKVCGQTFSALESKFQYNKKPEQKPAKQPPQTKKPDVNDPQKEKKK